MGTLYENIRELCEEKGIKGGKMCVDLGLSKSLMTDLKAGRKKGITGGTAQRIADYFGVSVERVLVGKEKAPSESGERVTDKQLKFALFDGAEDISDAQLDEVKAFAKWVKQRDEKKG